MRNFLARLSLWASLLSPCFAEQLRRSLVATSVLTPANKRNIMVIATGGTIAASALSETQKGYSSGQVGIDLLLHAIPRIADLANLSSFTVANVGSQDMNDEIWLTLAHRTNELLADPAVDGIVITHGTDTLEETSYFLNLVLTSEKPVVLASAMRPSSSLSADGPLNLYNCVAVAANPEAEGRGVLIVANDDIHGARSFTKTSPTDIQAFKSDKFGLIGSVHYGEVKWYRKPFRLHTISSEFSLEGVEKLPRVDVIYITAGVSADLIDAAVERGSKGIITAGVGNGNMTGEAIDAVQRAVAKGVVVVRSTRVTSGTVGRNVELDDDALGTVVSVNLNPARARVLLKLGLLVTTNPE
eukprot:Selendium_serpulae@DN9343_c0_g1_i1.p1